MDLGKKYVSASSSPRVAVGSPKGLQADGNNDKEMMQEETHKMIQEEA
jgi:hypothetical protein